MANLIETIEAIGERTIIEIRVQYGGAGGPDLKAVAEHAGCSEQEVIERHAHRTYRVYMLGFVPGFAYMGRVDPTIAAPRHRVPRERVPAGSVGIAGEQTGVYPVESPGGWQVIGRTATVMFDSNRATPSSVSFSMRKSRRSPFGIAEAIHVAGDRSRLASTASPTVR